MGPVEGLPDVSIPSSPNTVLAAEQTSGHQPESALVQADMLYHPTEEIEHPLSSIPVGSDVALVEPISPTTDNLQRPQLQTTASKHPVTEAELIKHLSRRGSTRSGDALSRATTQTTDHGEQAEIDRLMSRMFGRTRQENSEEEQTRHVGVSFKNLTVKGMGLGAVLLPTFGDVFLAIPRKVAHLLTRDPRKVASKPPVKTIIDDFSGLIRPGEMLLVLGRPGSGCSTFLKVLGNQRFGYESVTGDVLYGGSDAGTMLKK